MASSLNKRTVRRVRLASLASMVLLQVLSQMNAGFLLESVRLQQCLQTVLVSRVAGKLWARLHCLAGGTQMALKESTC